MNTRRMLVMFATLGVLLFATEGPGGKRGRRMPRYDPSTEATFKGTVEDVVEVSHPGMREKGLHATLKTDQGTLDVHIGPVSFAVKEQLTLAKGDELEVVGSKIKGDKGDAVIARTVKKGDKVTTLRSEKGIPLWSGGRGKRT